MSYPRLISPLVIEDDPTVKAQYEAIFQELSKKYPLETARWGFCYLDAMKHLSHPWPYQLVIVDLRLPEEQGQPESEVLDFGQSILDTCLRRDDYPVPALLVVSGNLQHSSSQELLEISVRNGFHYGRVLVKSLTNLASEIETAIQEVLRYQEVGVSVADGGNHVFPTISPREEDLLRRVVCRQEDAIGVNLQWWSATSTPSSGWTKVLIGRFLLARGSTYSLNHFFKLTAAEGAELVARSARSAGLTHQHLKVAGTAFSCNRSLLVTQSAGKSASRPTSLDEVFALPTERLSPSIPTIAAEVAEQIAAFGASTPDHHPISRLLWKFHSRDRIAAQWQRRGGIAALEAINGDGADPVELFDRLTRSSALIRYERQEARHGDLNFSNVAVEEAGPDQFNAWVFDVAAGIAGPNIRDLATLEITALLHQTPCKFGPLTEQCRGLFTGVLAANRSYGSNYPGTRGSNTHHFIVALRAQALRRSTPDVYAILLFDEALIQLGGLDFGSSYNKVHHPPDSAYLAALTAGLVLRTASRLL